MTEGSEESNTREVRIVRHRSARKVLCAQDWRARTEAQAIEARLDQLRSVLREEVRREVHAELADAFVLAATLAEQEHRSAHDLVELAVACAERLAQGELRAEPKRMRDVVASVLEQARDSGPLALLVHPTVRRQFADITTIAVHEDASLAPEDCIVEVRHGQFDGRLRTRAERLARLLGEAEAAAHD